MLSLDEICLDLKNMQRRRIHCIKSVNKLTNAAGALVRDALDWHPEMPKKERESVKKRAAAIVAAALTGKPQKAENEEAADQYGSELLATKLGILPYEDLRKKIELNMRRLTRQLAVSGWAKDDVLGLGELGLAVIIAEAGDMAKYANPGKLWRRLGLAPLNGKAMATWRREGGLTSEEWKTAGYPPKRRAELHACVAEPMVKHQLKAAAKSGTQFGEPRGPYGEAYVARRMRTLETHPEWTPKHAQMDALRIMTKQLILDLWVNWRRANAGMESPGPLPAAEPIPPAEPVKRRKPTRQLLAA